MYEITGCSLTMWDVNLDGVGFVCAGGSSCSLTMWDVNLHIAGFRSLLHIEVVL